MGDPTGGAASAAASAGGGGGGGKSGGGTGDPSIDPSAGMGGTDPGMGSAMGAVDTAAPGVDPGVASLFGQAGGGGGYDPTGSATAQQQIAGGGNLGPPGQPPTDQPSPQGGPQRYASAGGTPDVTPKEMGYQGLGPRTNLGALTSQPGQPSVPDIAHAFAGSGPDAPGIHWDPIEGGPVDIRQGPSVTVSPEESQTGQHGVDAPAPKYALPATPEGTNTGNLNTTPEGKPLPGAITGGTPITTGATPPATPPAATPATAAGGGGGTADTQGAAGPATDAAGQQGQQAGMGGRMPQSPLEQLIGQLLNPLEQMIMRALGINPNALFHAFQGGNPFNRQAGPGYYPPGTRGGRTVQSAGPPSLTPAPAQTGGRPQTPPRTPGPPGTPGNLPSATPPGRREAEGFDPTLPGYPYTGETRDQPPPWYRGGQPPVGGQASANGQAPTGASANYVSQNSIAASKIAGSDTRPTPGYSTTMREARARAFQGLDDQTRKLVAGMAASEHDEDPIGPIESLFNRSAHTGIPVRNLLYNGFYRNTAPHFASRAIQIQNSGQMGRYMAAIDAVQNGSNVLAGATDQGSAKLHDPNALNPSGRIIRFNETYNDHTPASARWRQEIQRRVQQELQSSY